MAQKLLSPSLVNRDQGIFQLTSQTVLLYLDTRNRDRPEDRKRAQKYGVTDANQLCTQEMAHYMDSFNMKTSF